MADSGQRKWWALGALSLSVLAVGLDGTVLSVALPKLSGALGATESDLQWFTSAYLLVLAAAMLPAGLLGDRYGRRKVLVWSLALFAISSAACAYSSTPGEFIAARSALGAAGAGIIVMALSALTILFDEEQRPKAVGIWSSANFLALPIGPLLGGWLLSHYWWGWVFLLNVPVALLGMGVVVALVPASRAKQRPDVDLAGILTSTLGLVAVTYGLIEAGQRGWSSAVVWLMIGGGLAVLAAFYYLERAGERRPGFQPLIDLSLFRLSSYTWGVVLIGFAALANIGVLFTMPQYFQGVQGTDAMGSGLRLLPLIGGLVLGALPAAPLAKAAGAKIVVSTGFALLAAGLLLGSATGTDSGTGFVAGWMALAGAGMGLAMATAASAALSEISEERSGVGSAVLQAVNKVGAPFGSAVLGSVLLAAYQSHLTLPPLPAPAADAARSGLFGGMAVAEKLHSAPLVESVRSSFTHGMDQALVVSGAIAVVGLLLAIVFMPARGAERALPQAADEREDDRVPGQQSGPDEAEQHIATTH